MRLDSARALALALVGLAIVVVIFAWTRVQPVQWGDGCGDDGLHYCAMAAGELAPQPWSRRFLLPGAIQALPLQAPHLPSVFLAANLLGVAAQAVGAGLLTRRLAQRTRMPARRANTAAILAGTLVVLSPMTFRFARHYPALVDNFSAGLGALWLVAATADGPRVRRLSPLLAFAATAAREAWSVTILVVLLTQLLIDGRRRATQAAVTAGAVALGLVLVLVHPALPGGNLDTIAHAKLTLSRNFLRAQGLVMLPWSIVWQVGLLPLILLAADRPWMRRDDREPGGARSMAVPALVGVAAQLPLGVLGGEEMHRYLAAVMALLLPPIVVGMVRDNLRTPSTLLLIGTLVLWRPFHAVPGDKFGYHGFFSPMFAPEAFAFGRASRDALLLLTPVLCSIAVALLRVSGRRAEVRKGALIGSPQRRRNTPVPDFS